MAEWGQGQFGLQTNIGAWITDPNTTLKASVLNSDPPTDATGLVVRMIGNLGSVTATTTARATAANPAYGEGVDSPISQDLAGNLRTLVTFPAVVHVDDNAGSLTVDGVFWQATQPISGSVSVSNFTDNGLTDTQLRATPVPVSGTFWQATQPVSGTFWQATQPVSGTFWQATQPVSVAAVVHVDDNASTLSVDDGGGSLTVDGTFWQATQPVSGTFWQATQPVSGTVTANQGTANATPWNENLAQIAGTAVVTSIAGSQGVGGDTADGAADAGKSVKVGGKVTLNTAALPAALTANQRGPAMIDEYGRFRVVVNRQKLLGNYKFESGRLTVLAAAHGATAGFFWIINPVGSAVVAYIKKLMATSLPTAVTVFASAPRITIERVTFTGVASGAQITIAKRDSTDAANTLTVRTASTGLTLTAGATVGDFSIPPVLTGVGVAVPVDQYLYDSTDDDDYVVIRAGEGLVIRQADAGTAADTRLLTIYGGWDER